MQLTEPFGPGRILQSLFLQWNPKGRDHKVAGVSDQEYIQWIAGFVQSCPDDDAWYQFCEDTAKMGWRLVGLLRRFAVEVNILDDPSFVSRYGHGLAGKYFYREKLVVLKESALYVPGPSITLHEFGHALDHMISILSHGSYKASASFWMGFSSRRGGFVSEYATTKPEEYFAESVSGFFHQASAQHLARHDEGMYAFLNALFSTSNM